MWSTISSLFLFTSLLEVASVQRGFLLNNDPMEVAQNFLNRLDRSIRTNYYAHLRKQFSDDFVYQTCHGPINRTRASTYKKSREMEFTLNTRIEKLESGRFPDCSERQCRLVTVGVDLNAPALTVPE